MRSIFLRVGRASERLAVAVTAVVISPWSFWVLFSLCLLQFVSAKIATDVLYVSNDIQLLLLPLLGISQTASAAGADKRSRREYEGLVRRVVEMDAKIDEILAIEWAGGANGVRDNMPPAGEDFGEDSGA